VSRIRFDRRRLGVGDVIVAGASLVLMIGIYLPWFEFGSKATGYFSFDATAVRSWMDATFIIALSIVVYLSVRVTVGEFWSPLPHWFILLGASGVNLVLTVACFAKKASGVSWDVGAYLSVLAAITAVAGALVRRSERGAGAGGASSSHHGGLRRPRDPVVPMSPRQVNAPGHPSSVGCATCGRLSPRTTSVCASCGRPLHG
jgi:hypothetical protein